MMSSTYCLRKVHVVSLAAACACVHAHTLCFEMHVCTVSASTYYIANDVLCAIFASIVVVRLCVTMTFENSVHWSKSFSVTVVTDGSDDDHECTHNGHRTDCQLQ